MGGRLTELVVGLPITGSLLAASVISVVVAEVARDARVVMDLTVIVMLVHPPTQPMPQYASVLPLGDVIQRNFKQKSVAYHQPYCEQQVPS